jgi:hypothetical protein
MYSGLEDAKESQYIKILREYLHDYKKLFNVEDFREDLAKSPFPNIRDALTKHIQKTKKDKNSRIVPILISYKAEITLLFDLIEEKIQDVYLVNVPIPPESIRIYYHFYTCLIEEFGLEILEEIANKIQTQNIREGKCVKALTNYLHDKEKREAVIQWFLGEELSENEKNLLGFENSIQTDDKSLEMIKLIGETTNKIIILYFDDIELPYEKHGASAQRKYLEALKRLHHDVNQLIIILICPKKMWPTISSLADGSLRSILERQLAFNGFSLVKTLIAERNDVFWLKRGYAPPTNKYFPFNEKIVTLFFEQSKGDIRNFLKIYKRMIDKLISGDLSE